MKLFYLCDKKQNCCASVTCGGKYCNHTEDVEHALNGACDDPENSERFKKTELGDYWEVQK